MSAALTAQDIQHIAKLANLPLTDEQAKELTQQVGITVDYVSQLQSLPTDQTSATAQVTGLENIFRDDVVDTSLMFTQKEALANALRAHNGLFIVDALFEEP